MLVRDGKVSVWDWTVLPTRAEPWHKPNPHKSQTVKPSLVSKATHDLYTHLLQYMWHKGALIGSLHSITFAFDNVAATMAVELMASELMAAELMAAAAAIRR